MIQQILPMMEVEKTKGNFQILSLFMLFFVALVLYIFISFLDLKIIVY